MRDFILGGRVLDVIIGLTVLEALALIVWRGRAWSVVGHLGAGACLALAFRLYISDVDWRWIAASLAAAGAVHLLDMLGRLTRRLPPKV